ncbi:MAG: uroporphyrinogen decarboxylase family protein [Thermoproteota archaeon]
MVFITLVEYLKPELTSKERLLSALLLEEPDTVPVSVRVGGISIPWMAEASILEWILRNSDVMWRTGIQGANIFFTNTKAEEFSEGDLHILKVETPKGTLSSITRDTIKDRPYVGSWTLKHFLETDEDIEKFLSIPYVPTTPNFGSLNEERRWLGDRGVMVIGISDPVGVVGQLFPLSRFFLHCLERKQIIKEMLELMFERIYDYLEKVLKVDEDSVIEISGPEFVAPPFLDPSYFRELVVEYDRELIELIHQHSHLASIHCHGKVGKLLESIAEMGTDALHPIEPPPSGDADLADAKRRVGEKICLIGNIQLDDLVRRREGELEERCKEAIEKAALGGGFILEPTATPLPDTPVKNLIRFVKAGRKFGTYPRDHLDIKI